MKSDKLEKMLRLKEFISSMCSTILNWGIGKGCLHRGSFKGLLEFRLYLPQMSKQIEDLTKK